MTRLRLTLEVLATLSVIAASGVLISSAVAITPRSRPAAAVYNVGDSVEMIPGLDLGAAPATLLLFIREGCRFCDASLGFYKRLTAGKQAVRVVALSYDDDAKLAGYVNRNGLMVDQLISAKPGSWRVSGTPTLVLVDQLGKVKAVWRGQLRTAAEEEQVLRTVAAAGTR